MRFRARSRIHYHTQDRRPVKRIAHPEASECEAGRVGKREIKNQSPFAGAPETRGVRALGW